MERCNLAEIKLIIKNYTWTLVHYPSEGKIIGSHTVLRNEFNADGIFEKRKARLAMQGFTQEYKIHYSETFVPVARICFICFMASLAVNEN